MMLRRTRTCSVKVKQEEKEEEEKGKGAGKGTGRDQKEEQDEAEEEGVNGGARCGLRQYFRKRKGRDEAEAMKGTTAMTGKAAAGD